MTKDEVDELKAFGLREFGFALSNKELGILVNAIRAMDRERIFNYGATTTEATTIVNDIPALTVNEFWAFRNKVNGKLAFLTNSEYKQKVSRELNDIRKALDGTNDGVQKATEAIEGLKATYVYYDEFPTLKDKYPSLTFDGIPITKTVTKKEAEKPLKFIPKTYPKKELRKR